MSLDIANSNVNRNITLAGTSVAIFTFLLFFLYPKYQLDQINSLLFQVTLAVIVSVIFSLVISATWYYANTIRMITPSERGSSIFGKADAAWVVGYTLLLLEPTLILFTVNLPVVAYYALVLWFVYILLTMVEYTKQTRNMRLRRT